MQAIKNSEASMYLYELVEKLIFPPEQLKFKPITSYMPFSYRLVPEGLRIQLLKLLSKNKEIQIDNQLSNHPFELLWKILSVEQKNELSKKYGIKEFDKLILLSHDVEGLSTVEISNIEQIARIEEDNGFRSCWNFIGLLYNWNKPLVEQLKKNHHEIGLHGFYHDNIYHLRSEIELDTLFKTISSKIEEYNILGGRMPSWYVDRRILRIFAKFFKYDLSMQDETVIKKFPVNSCGCVRPYFVDGILEIPTNINFGKLDAYDIKVDSISEYWLKKAMSIQEAKGLVVSMTHPSKGHLIGKERLNEYDLFLKKIKEKGIRSILPSELLKQT